MLVIGSRALRHSFADARCVLDWDVVGTRAEADRLLDRLEPLEGVTWTRAKAYFLCGDRPLEFIIADDGVWADVLALPGLPGSDPRLGPITFAHPETLLLLKLGHVHLTHHWRKTASDVAFLLDRRVSVARAHEPLLERLRRHAERRRGDAKCAFGPPLRIMSEPASAFAARLRPALHRTLGDRAREWVDPERPELARGFPTSNEARAALLAELAMVHAVEHVLVPDVGLERPTDRQERDAFERALETLCTDVLGRVARIELAPFAEHAARRVPRRFSHRLLSLVARATQGAQRGAHAAWVAPRASHDLSDYLAG